MGMPRLRLRVKGGSPPQGLLLMVQLGKGRPGGELLEPDNLASSGAYDLEICYLDSKPHHHPILSRVEIEVGIMTPSFRQKNAGTLKEIEDGRGSP